MAEYPKNVTLQIMGSFEGSTYVGGETQVVPLFNDSVLGLRYSINHVLPEMWRSSSYEMIYFSRTWMGRKKKHVISDDEDLSELLRSQPNPTVYVDHDNIEVGSAEDNVEQSGEEVYVPSFEAPECSGYVHNTHSTQFDQGLEAIERYASFNWLGDDEQAASGSYQEDIPTYNQPWQNTGSQYWQNTTSQERQASPYTGAAQEEEHHADEEEYVALVEAEAQSEAEAETDSSASDDMSESEHIRFTAAEFAGWVNREGGLGRVISLINAGRHVDEAEDELPTEITELSNWLVPVIPVDAAASVLGVEYNTGDSTELSVNSFYHSKQDLLIAVGLWNMKQGAETKVRKSDQRRVCFTCKHSTSCPFDLRASSNDGVVWRVHKFTNQHTCDREVGRVNRIKAHSKVVAAYVARKIHNDGEIMKPKTIKDELQSEFGVRISYDLALRARNQAIETIYGGHDQSFELLPKYLYMLKRANPSSLVDMDVGDDGRFRHLFIALGAPRSCFMWSMRPVIVVDGTHLKGKNHGILFVAVTKDGNEQVYPLAYGVGPKENDESWKWFISHLRIAYGECESLVIVSDAHVSIGNAVRSELPQATHCLCYYHLLSKIKCYGKSVAELYRIAAYASESSEFETAMETMQRVRPEAYNKLINEVGPEKWARSQCPVKRYSFLTSNAAETFNGRLLWARRLPICSMLEAIRIVMEQWFSERLAATQRSEDYMTEEGHRRIAAEVQRSRRYRAKRTSDRKYKVQAGDRRLLVDLRERTCECGSFQLDELPCAHAIAAISEADGNIQDYVSPYYTRHYLNEAYSGDINHLPPRRDWNVPDHISDQIVLPPAVIRQAGRPRMSRRRSGGENATRGMPRVQEDAPMSSRRRAPKKCSACGQAGHTRRTCAGRATD